MKKMLKKNILERMYYIWNKIVKIIKNYVKIKIVKLVLINLLLVILFQKNGIIN